jgi:Protein of unknown function (DUF2911)
MSGETMQKEPWMNHRRWMTGLLAQMMLTTALIGQSPSTFQLPTTNPRAVVRQAIAATEVEVTYGRPRVKGRTIFGALVPYDQVWRTGSDAATRIRFSTPVSIEGVPVGEGDYELFTIPGEKEWVVILQPARSQWGSYSYDPANDAARVTVQPLALHDRVESFTIGFDDVTTNAAILAIAWDRIRVPVRLTVDVRATVVPQLEAALQADGKRPYFLGAMFYYENDLDLDRAAELIALALESQPNHVGMLYRQALILDKKGDRDGAIAAAERSLAAAADQNPELRDEYIRLNTALLSRLRNP